MTQSLSVCLLFCVPLFATFNSRPLLVEQILARTQTERLMKIYDLPTVSSTLEFATPRSRQQRSPCAVSVRSDSRSGSVKALRRDAGGIGGMRVDS